MLPRALASRVREDVDLAKEAARVLDPREAKALAAAPDAPAAVDAAITGAVVFADLGDVGVPALARFLRVSRRAPPATDAATDPAAAPDVPAPAP